MKKIKNNNATKYIEEQCAYDGAFAHNVKLLDKYDFSEFLEDCCSIWTIRSNIEKKYDKEFLEKYQQYVFDNMDGRDTAQYFESRYNIWFLEEIDWVSRKYGTN